MSENLALTASGKFEYTPTGLRVHGTPSRDEWLAAYDELMRVDDQVDTVKDRCRWNIGDMLVYGEMRFSEAYAQAVGYKVQTVRNIMTVCRNIPYERRREDVRFWTHAEVGGLPPQQQDELLLKAALEGLKEKEVRQAKRLLTGYVPPMRYTVQGKNAQRDVHGVTPVLVIEYWPETEEGDIPPGLVEVVVRPQKGV